MQQGVSVVKASAGSGKTFRLTSDYIDLLLSGDEQSYKHILAVTFTNKATDEMKSRVIERLHKLSQGSGKDAGKARLRLRRLLHDYSCFSVSTIDKFFQTVMRSFAREIGQYASYRVELDTDAVLSQVVDLMIDSIEDPQHVNLLQWLREYSFDLVEQGGNWNISGPLNKMARQFLDESFLLRMREAGSRGADVIGDRVSLKAFLKKLDGIVKDYDDTAEAIGKEGLALLEKHGFAPDKVYQGSRGATMYFKKWAEHNFPDNPPSESYIDGAIKKFPDHASLEAMFEKVKAHFSEPLKQKKTAALIRENLYLLGIYSDLQRLLDEYLKENNVVLLQLSTDLLSRIIADDDTPFVYEKIGNRYDNLMLDEAQDTSLMQWNNFRPLFRNSQASGGCNLIVGDIKQSIYRWRGSDWRLMRDYLKRDLAAGFLHGETLDENWRSGKAVIDFNNSLFGNVGGILSADSERSQFAEEVSEIYSDSFQNQPKEHEDDPEGFVRLGFIRKNSEEASSWKDAALERMISDISGLLSEGFDYKDITVLVRTNREGGIVADALIAAGISVLTEDSLQIGSSPCIAKLMSLLGWLVNPDDPVGELQSREFKDMLPDIRPGSIYETCEQLLACEALSHAEQDLPFINAFLDAVLAFQEKYGSSLRAFVKWWEDAGHKKSICAPDGQNAVRVMTIHKSKGLSLEAVIIPFCSEGFTPTFFHQPTIWCSTPESFGGPALVPLRASSSLKGTYFEKDFEQERLFELIDVINTWYVAFTRPRSRLLIYAPLGDQSNDLKASCIENMLYLHFGKQLNEDGVLELGVREPFVREHETSSLVDDPQPAFEASSPGEGSLKLSLHGDDYFAEDKSARQRGIESHGEMARIDISPEYEALSGFRHWFDGTFRVMNEASIVDGSGEIRRPDRVLLSRDGGQVIVIDYKFGKPHSDHRRQVREYVSLMRQMGYASVTGYLWYLSTNHILQV